MSLDDHRRLWCSTVHATVLEDDKEQISSQIFAMKNTFDKQQNVHSVNNSE